MAGLGNIMQLLMGQNGAAAQPATAPSQSPLATGALPPVLANMNPAQNFWQGNQFVIPPFASQRQQMPQMNAQQGYRPPAQLTPGMELAMSMPPSGGNKLGLLGQMATFPLGGLFKQNSPYIDDIRAALSRGQTISDKSWRQAGFGPGGAALQPTDVLSRVR